MLCTTPSPPYYAVIFTSVLVKKHKNSYVEMAQKMLDLVSTQKGFLGMDSSRSSIGITVSYWEDMESIEKWKNNILHRNAKKAGKELFYEQYHTRIAKVEYAY